MTDLPYTYTEPNGDSLRMFSDGPDLVVTVRQDGGARTVVVPREETPNLARAVLAAAGDTTEAQDAQLPDRGGDVIDDIRVALAQRHGLSDEHRAFYFEIVNRFEGLAADRDGVRLTRDRYRDERNIARAELADARRWGRILEAQRKDLRKKLSAETDRVAALRIAYQAAKDADLPETDMVEPGDEVSDRVGALEQQYTDLADLVHGHGEDLARLRRRFTEEDDG